MIELEHIVHDYGTLPPWRRRARALDGVSLRLKGGGVVGLMGVNGAGKTTLLRIVLGYLRPGSGRATIAGMPARAFVERHGVGYVPERVSIPPAWTVEGALRAYGMLGDGVDLFDRVEATLQRLGLEALRRRRVGALSKGNLQRLALAQALLGDRDLLVLDEPTDGLDPLWVAELRAILEEWRGGGAGRVAIVATHDLHFIERVADRVVMLHGGRVVADLPRSPDSGDEPLEAVFLRHARQGGAA